jgi:hypothetical protein
VRPCACSCVRACVRVCVCVCVRVSRMAICGVIGRLKGAAGLELGIAIFPFDVIATYTQSLTLQSVLPCTPLHTTHPTSPTTGRASNSM